MGLFHKKKKPEPVVGVTKQENLDNIKADINKLYQLNVESGFGFSENHYLPTRPFYRDGRPNPNFMGYLSYYKVRDKYTPHRLDYPEITTETDIQQGIADKLGYGNYPDYSIQAYINDLNRYMALHRTIDPVEATFNFYNEKIKEQYFETKGIMHKNKLNEPFKGFNEIYMYSNKEDKAFAFDCYKMDGMPTHEELYLKWNDQRAKFLGFQTAAEYCAYNQAFWKMTNDATRCSDKDEFWRNDRLYQFLIDYHQRWADLRDTYSASRTPEGIANEKRMWGLMVCTMFTKCYHDYASTLTKITELEPTSLCPDRMAMASYYDGLYERITLDYAVEFVDTIEKASMVEYENAIGHGSDHYKAWKERTGKTLESEEMTRE